MPASFPRGTDAPAQSPLFWVNNKDRYLRQLLIRDIQDVSGRELIVYFTDCDRTNAQIDGTDENFLLELLNARGSQSVDLFLETNGGQTDATEKICSILRGANLDLRVIVPRRAKSNGTVIALAGKSILMSDTSELGPIDPSIDNIPADYIVKITPQNTLEQVIVQRAHSALKQTEVLAKQLLETGMLKGTPEADIAQIISKLGTRNHYHSHGSVIDASEATTLGLKIDRVPPTDALWQKLWLLRTMYSYDCQHHNYSKVFESATISSPVSAPKIS